MKCYISGPITGQPNGNKEAFEQGAICALAKGYQPINPHNNGLDKDSPWIEHMRADIKSMMDCDVIMLLPGWRKSKGARIEAMIAQALGFDRVQFEQDVADRWIGIWGAR